MLHPLNSDKTKGVKATIKYQNKPLAYIFHQDILNVKNISIAKIRPIIGLNGVGKTTQLKFQATDYLQEIEPKFSISLFCYFKQMASTVHLIKFGVLEINYSIDRTSRKTIGINIEPDGKVIVKAPLNLEEEKIKETVFKKREWIADKVKLLKEIKKPIPPKQELVSGEKILLKNRLIRLKIHTYPNKRPKISYAFRILHIYVNGNLSQKQREEELKRVLIKWYKEKAFNLISNRIKKYLKLIDYKPQEIKVRDQRIRWASCIKDGKLIFNWRIIIGPKSTIDYVIVHELCHMKEPTHSAKFWEMVESLFPNYKKWKEWLRINGKNLDLRK